MTQHTSPVSGRLVGWLLSLLFRSVYPACFSGCSISNTGHRAGGSPFLQGRSWPHFAAAKGLHSYAILPLIPLVTTPLTMACDNCKTGFKWNGTSTGKESTLNNIPAYVTGDSKDAAVLIVTDIFGWTLPNIRILADHYAKEANATVYIPDV